MEKITIKVKNLKGLKLNYEDKRQTLLEILQLNRIDWMHACGGKGRCTTCTAIIIEGADLLDMPNIAEQKMIDRAKLKSNERLACQLIPKGSLVIKVPKLYQLPHMEYEDA